MNKLVLLGVSASLAIPSIALAAPPSQPAQQAPQARMAPPPSTAAPKVSDAEFHHFVQAYEALRPIRMKYMQQLRQTKDKKKQMQIKQQGMTEMKQKIGNYMPVSQYVQVGKAINKNPTLRQRFMKTLAADRTPASST